MKKLNRLFKKETKIFNDFVAAPEDVRVVIINHIQALDKLKTKNPTLHRKLKDIGAMVKIVLTNDNTNIAVVGYGPEVVSAFYQAKNKMIKTLNKITQLALSDTDEPVIMPKAVSVTSKILH